MGCCFDVSGLNGGTSELGFLGFLGFYDFMGCCFSVGGLNGVMSELGLQKKEKMKLQNLLNSVKV